MVINWRSKGHLSPVFLKCSVQDHSTTALQTWDVVNLPPNVLALEPGREPWSNAVKARRVGRYCKVQPNNLWHTLCDSVENITCTHAHNCWHLLLLVC